MRSPVDLVSRYRESFFELVRLRGTGSGGGWPEDQNHSAAVALYYFAYNFIKIRGTLSCTPAMAPSVTDRLWEGSDLVALLEADERARKSGVKLDRVVL